MLEMNSKIVLSVAAVLTATFALMSVSLPGAYALPVVNHGPVAQNAQNTANQGPNAQTGLVNLGNTNVEAALNLNCAVNAAVLGGAQC
jgi:hypothetical protein